MRSVCAVEVAVEVEQVGLDQHAAAGLERRAHADVDGGGDAGEAVPLAGRRRRRGRGTRARRRARGWRSGSRARGRACRRRRPRRRIRNGAPRNSRGLRRPRRRPRSPRMWLEDTVSPCDLDQRHDAGLEAGVGREQRRVAARAGGRSGSSPPPTTRWAPSVPTSTSSTNASALCVRRSSRSKGITTSSSTPSAAISSALRREVGEQLGRRLGADHRRAGAGSNVSTVSAPGDHLAVAEVDAVEGPDGDAARARLGVGEAGDLHAAEAYDGLELAVPRLGDGDQPVAVGEPHDARPALAAGSRAAVAGRRAPRRRRAGARAGTTSASASGDQPLRRRRPRPERADRGARAAPRSRRRRGRRSGCGRRCPSEHSISKRGAVALAPAGRSKRWTVTVRSGVSTSSPAAGLLVRALAADLAPPSTPAGAGSTSPVGSGERRPGTRPVSAISPSGSPVVERRAEPRDRRVGLRAAP